METEKRAATPHATVLLTVLHMPELEPLLASVVNARKMLGGIGHNQFWALVKAGELEVVGNEHKRWVTTASIKARVARMMGRLPWRALL